MPDTFVTGPTPPASTWRSPGARMPRLDAGRGPSPAWADLSHLLYKAATSKELSPSPIRSYEQIEHAILSCERHTPRGWGSTGRGLSVLHEGPTYPECPRPSSSGSRPSCSTGRAPSQRLRVAEPPRRRGASGQEGPVHPRRCLKAPRHPAHWRGLRSGRPTGGLRCHGPRSSQVMRQLAGLSGTATRSGPSPRRGPRPRCPGPARHRGSWGWL